MAHRGTRAPIGSAVALLILLAAAAAGCIAERDDQIAPSERPTLPSPTLRSSPSAPGAATLEPTPSVGPIEEPGGDPETPAPTIPARPDPFVAVERDGVRLSLQLERNPMPSGAETWIRTVVTNVGDREIGWGSDGCEVPLWVFGEMPDRSWRPGIDQPTAERQAVKGWALDSIRGDRIAMGFMPSALARRGVELGEFGCGDIFIGHQLPAGASIVDRQRWDGTAMFVGSPMPGGRVRLTARFDTWWHGRDMNDQAEPIEIHLDAWVAGVSHPPRLDPAEAVDAALADPVFGPWLIGRPLRSGADLFVKFDAGRHAWRVGLQTFDPTRTRVCNVDADSGAVISITGTPD